MKPKIEDMHPLLLKKYYLWASGMNKARLTYALTSVARNILEQMSLYVQGRLDLAVVNSFRYHAGLYIIPESENKVVTWTLNSKHVTNWFDKDLDNDKAKAFDFVILKGGRMTWDIKISVNENEIPDYEEARTIGVEVGLGFVENDWCHLEL